MKVLPILLFAICYLLFAPPVSAAEPPLETIGTIEKENPTWGEDIVIEKRVTITKGGFNLGQIEVGLKEGKDSLKFPNLLELTNTATNAIPFLLPQELLEEYKQKPPEEKELTGKIFHPVCRALMREEDGEFENANPKEFDPEKLPKGASEVKTPSWWTRSLAVTKLAQAIGVPGFSSGVQFQIPELPKLGDEQNEPLPDCPQPQGPADGEIVNQASFGQTFIVFNLLKVLVDWFNGIVGGLLPGGEETRIVQFFIKPKKFIPGELEFAKQTADESSGFLQGFYPQELSPKGVNEQETTPYEIDKRPDDKRLEFLRVCGARKGFLLLQQSLYPEDLMPKELKEQAKEIKC